MIAALPDAFAERMRDAGLDPWRRNEAELVPPRAVSAHAGVLREALGAHAGGHNAYASEMIADALEYCLVYVSWNEILVRPLIPPTSEHHPFADAQQRIYMSATFGSGGELERSFGVPRIERLPVATMANGKSPDMEKTPPQALPGNVDITADGDVPPPRRVTCERGDRGPQCRRVSGLRAAAFVSTVRAARPGWRGSAQPEGDPVSLPDPVSLAGQRRWMLGVVCEGLGDLRGPWDDSTAVRGQGG